MRPNLVALILACAAPPGNADPVRIDISAPHVSGLSGIEVTGDGAGFLAVTDVGWIVEGRLDRDNGTLVGADVQSVRPIIGQNGFPVRARNVGDWWDAEGLALMPDGTAYISFERWTRVARHASIYATGEWIADHADFFEFDVNRQLEAVAVDANGTVFTFPEAPVPGGGFPVYRLDPEGWTIASTLPASDAYSLVGADFGPEGQLYILDRKLIFATWFQSRIRRVDLESGHIETLWESRPGALGNLEGLSVWPDGDRLRATMVSDNNGKAHVATEIVEICLTD